MTGVGLARSEGKELEALPDATLVRIARRLDQLAQDPRPPGCKKLRGQSNLWRIRVGSYRIVYLVDDRGRLVDVRAVGDRKDIYG